MIQRRRYFHSNIDVKTSEEIETKLQKFILSHKQSGLPWFLIFELSSNKIMGRIGLWRYKTGEIEVGFALHKDFWGQGFATEALSAILKWANQNIEKDNIIAVVTIDNIASARVLEKCGMQIYKVDVDQGEACRFYRVMNK